jgi:hypothetical protein
MAAVTLLGTATFNTSSGTKTVTATPAVDDLIVIFTAHSANTSSAEPTDNQGGTYVLINSALKNTSADAMRLWVRRGKITAASSTVFTHAPGTSTGGGLAVLKVTGMSRVGIAAIRQSAVQQNQSAATPAPVFGSAALTANACVGACFNATNPATMTQRSSWTERVDTGYTTTTHGLHVMSRDSGETGTTQTWGSASASAFSSIVAELNIDAADPVEDGDWWSGTNLNAAGIAITGIAAAALATSVAIAGSFNHNDEIGTAALAVGGGGTNAAAPAPDTGPRLFYWHQPDDLPITPPTVALGEDEWQPRVSPQPVLSSLVWVDDDLPVTAVVTAPPDETEWQARPLVQTITPMVFIGEDFTPLAAPAVDDSWQSLRPTVTPVSPLVWWDNDQIAQTVVVSSGGGGLIHDPVNIIRWYQDDGIPTPAVPLQVEDDNAAPLRSRFADPTSVVWAENDDFPITASPAQDIDPAYYFAPKIVNITLPIWRHNDEIAPGGRPLEDDSLPIKDPQPATINGIIWVENDEIVSTPPTLAPREEYWHQSYSIPVKPVSHLWLVQDERETAVTPLQVDEENSSLTLTRLVNPTSVVWAENDDFPVTPAVPNEEYWVPPFSIPGPIVNQIEKQQDEWEIIPPPLFTDVEFWPDFQLRTAIVPALAPLFQSDDEQGEFVAPVPVERVEIGGGPKKKRKTAKQEREELLDEVIKEILVPAKKADLPAPLQPVAQVIPVVVRAPVVPLTMPPAIEIPAENDDEIIAALIALGLF